MKSGRDKEKENDRCISSHMQTLHRRLIHALNLGTRHFDEKTNRWRWQCANIEVQKNVLRSIGAFLDSLSGDARAARHAVVKESVPDILGALLWILQCKNEALLSMASNVAVKLVSVLPNPLLQSHMLDLVYCLSSLLSSHQVEVAIPCATTLNFVISNLSATNEKEVMEALKETEASLWIVGNIKDFAEGVKKIEYFEEMSLLLSTILWRWPPSRFSVCNDVILMKGLANIHTKTDSSIKLALLKLYTSIALCDSAARRLIEDEEIFPQMFVQAMGKSNPHAIRIEGFRLAQCLLRSQDNCLKVVGLCGDALVEAIICGMTEPRVTSKKFGNNHGSLSVEACQLALITRWAGDHHTNFWKQGIDRVLLSLLIENIEDQLFEPVLALEKQIYMAKEGLKANYHLGLRSYLWDILGWLTIHWGENLNPYTRGSELCIKLLITCACLSFVDTLEKWCRICQKDIDDHFQSEPVSRAVLMMIHSPCNSISSHTKFLLSDVLKVKGMSCLKSLLHTLDYTSSLESYGSFDKLQLVINLIGFTCLSSLPQYQRCIIESKGIKVIVLLLKRCLNNDIHIERQSFTPHLHTHERSWCCFDKEDWEGSNILLFYSLLALTEILHQCDLLQENPQQFSGEVTNITPQFVSKLQEICKSNSFSPGVRWKSSKEIADEFVRETVREVRLSSHVGYETLVLLLEYVYLGCLRASEEAAKKLKVLAKRCNLQPLFQMLHRQHPKWGLPFPSFNLTSAFGLAGSCFSDIVLGAKSNELAGWTCDICSDTVPHMHVHKVILQSGCDYLQGLFRSGMQESHSQVIKVDISWQALIKLVQWFYSDELPGPPSGCLWDNMDDQEKLFNLQPYVELYWLAEFWILENIQEACFNVIMSCLDSSWRLSIRIIKMAYNLSLWKLVDIAANLMAPSYRQLRDSGELEEFDDALVHLIYSASIQLN
ncbi:BTB/POZ domain-containing protein At1g04390 isoform X2 [Vigna umbellata]|uniref:BTB/POZ domain-containing protein At1g04390 isoform X2 n=1 Tax=Vigna umbellata TaxID=87088 RepID=UPI001F5E9DDC|nr:BTB/POZ domain-containing protein At1g04390 isoform X2 [Vigna umbellata]